MKLLRLEITNFRQHRDCTLEFKDGLTGIIGLNGAGKSTLIEAISFALFGSKALRGKVEDVPSRGVKVGTSVSLWIALDGVVYRVVRSMSDAELYLGGEATPIVTGNREVVSKIVSILGMSYEEYLATFYTEQKGLEFLSGKRGATEREKFIVRMMGFDKLEDIQELLRSDKRDIRNTLAGFEAGLIDRESLVSQIADEKAGMDRIEIELQDKGRILENHSKDHDELKKLYEALNAVKVEWSSRKDRLLKSEASYEEKVRLLRIKEEERKKLLIEGGPLPSEDNLAESLRGFKAERTRLEAIKSANVTQLHDEKVKFHAAKSGLESRVELLGKQKDDIHKRLKSAKKLGDKGACPTCGQKLGGSHLEVLTHLSGEIQAIEDEVSLISKELEFFRKDPEIVTLKNEENSEIESQLIELNARIVEAETLQKRANHLLVIEREIERLRQELKASDHDLATARSDLSSLKFSEEEYLARKARFDASTELLNLLRMQRLQLEGDSKAKRALYERASKSLDEQDSKRDSLAKAKRELILMEEGDKALTEFRKNLNATLRPRLAELASDFISDLTDGRYKEVELLSDFTPTLVDGGEASPVISGGEADILNLCVRLALSQMLAERAGQQLSLLVLDEVFGSLDEQRRFNVLALLERLANRFEQIFVITHMDDIKEGVEHLIEVTYDEDKEGSVASEISLSSPDY